MRYVSLKKSKVLSALALSVTVSSCSLRSNGQQQTVTIALPGAQISQFQWIEKMTDWMSMAVAGSTTLFNLDDTPTALSDFDCFAVNVSGPGIPLNPNVSCSNPDDAPAILGGFVPNGNTSIDMLVPAGPNRSIKILGIKSLIGCPNFQDMVQDGTIKVKDNVGHFYTIGGVSTDIFADTNVNIKVSYNSNSPIQSFDTCKRNNENNSAHIWNVFAGTGAGYINTTKTVNSTTYIGGKFDYVGPTTQQGAMLSQSNGALASTNNNPAHISGTVRCSVRDGQGGFYVGGSFSHVESNSYSPPAGLIHINSDGSFDTSFVVLTSAAGEAVYTCAKDDSTLFLGGNFTGLQFNSNAMTSANALAAIPLSSPSIINMGSVISPSGPIVLSMDIDRVRGKLYVGGTFGLTSILSGHSNAAAFSNSSGYAAVSGWHPDPLGAVNAVYADAASANGYVYLGGPFTSPKSYLFRVGADGSIDGTWTSALSGTAFSIAADSAVYVAAYDGSSIPHVYRLNSDGSIAATLLTTGGTPEPINSIALSTDGSNQLYVGGKFNFADHQNLIAISDPAVTATVNPSFRADTNSGARVNTVSTNGVGKLFVGGDFASIGGVIHNNVAAIDLTTGQATSWHSPYTGLGDVKAIESDGNSIYVGYDHVTSTSPPGVLKIGTDGSSGGQWVTATYSDDIFALSLDNGYLYVGGMFSSLTGGSGYTNVARINVGTGGGPTIDTTWKPVIGTVSDSVSQIIANGDTTYIKGSFTTANGSSMNHLVAVQSGSGSVGTANSTGWNNPTFITTSVDSMLFIPAGTYSFVPSGAIMIGRVIAGTPTIQLVPLTGGSVPVPGATPLAIPATDMSQIKQLARAGDFLYVAGQATGTLGQALLVYDLTSNSQTPISEFNANIQNSYSVNSIEVFGSGTILVGGNFYQVNTTPSTGADGMMSWGIGLFDAINGKLY